MAHGHNRGARVITGILMERPGFTITTVSLDFVPGKTMATPDVSPHTPCGTGWDFVCAGRGNRFHTETPTVGELQWKRGQADAPARG